MVNSIVLIRQSRKNFLSLMNSLTDTELNIIPACYNNNIIWNAAHTITTIQILCYKNAGLEGYIDNEFVALYRKGTHPEVEVTGPEIQVIKKKMLNSIDQLERDYKAGLFRTYNNYTTSFGIEIKSIDEAIQFLVIHEGIHLGYAMALKRLVNIAKGSMH
ncbi:MAG: DinB family protein [Balneolales bacterium]